ncbi:plasmid stabilization protein [Ureibacillus massiliensis 4400831 = CIP 108448 = CCUG 49529]|uniref:Plasmid stabilization protein n=1 Tax=Ureibacillus massiliensis 4400831 = CIP 108448 = CCUG 49529 TaxID=1211035 RepID=A0A0A3J242_9BACL|nr:type II toxin-antitoxin system RelE/ParE family toxin [Ureibacillus massiliensis]KGR91089.1 plasmid stabilization protein [Ureibacillus massiliensis 4400831 = CIP 108448 = CCUG 49529]
MKVSIVYSEMALEDLQLLKNYLFSNWGEDVTKKVISKITTDVRSLEIFPLSGVPLAKNIQIPTELRYLVSEKNYIFYYHKSDTVTIVRILNERQNYIAQLFQTSTNTNNID